MCGVLVATAEELLNSAIRRHLFSKGGSCQVMNSYLELEEVTSKETPRLLVVEPTLCSSAELRALQCRVRKKKIPVIVITSLPQHLAVRHAAKFAAAALLVKPCEFTFLCDAIDSVERGYSVFPKVAFDS